LLQKASTPIFSAKKRDCQTLLDFFSSKLGGETVTGQKTISSPRSDSLPQSLTMRDPSENHPDQFEGWVMLKGKKDKEEDFFVGGKGKGSKKGRRHTDGSSASSSSHSTKMSIPLGILNILISLEITPPSTTADVLRTVNDIQKKLDWFDENEAKETEENVSQMRAFLQRAERPPIIST